MKKILSLGMAALLVLAASCTGSNPGFKTEKRHYEGSSEHATLSIDAELPLATTEGAAVMRQTLVDVMDKALSQIDSYAGKRFFPRFDGDTDDSEALFSYYEKQALDEIASLAQQACDERAEGILESTTLTDEEKESYLKDMPGWAFDFHLAKVYETDSYAVFDSQNYIYMGGAHGGVVGDGPMTFDKKSGMRIRDFFAPGSQDEMQEMLRRGMGEYFKERIEDTGIALDDHLSLNGGPIPLPQWAPCPTADGLKLIYQQYEVAPYAAGMPEFTLSYEEVAPFLLPEAKADLGL